MTVRLPVAPASLLAQLDACELLVRSLSMTTVSGRGVDTLGLALRASPMTTVTSCRSSWTRESRSR
jgi:hypothetical protein